MPGFGYPDVISCFCFFPEHLFGFCIVLGEEVCSFFPAEGNLIDVKVVWPAIQVQVGEILDLVALTFVFLIGLSFCAEPRQEVSFPVHDLVEFPFCQDMGRTVAIASGEHILKGLIRVRSGVREDALEDEH
ncbi:hypothetical protein DSECCO2_621330 [anaerobic digester metagenome]